MSKLTFDYPHLDNAQKIFKCIQKHYNEFDWSGPDADRAKNFLAVQRLIVDKEVEDLFDIRLWIVEDEDGERIRSLYTYDERINTYVDLNPVEGIEQWFDFGSPLDILNLLDDFEERASEFKSFYQIKVA